MITEFAFRWLQSASSIKGAFQKLLRRRNPGKESFDYTEKKSTLNVVDLDLQILLYSEKLTKNSHELLLMSLG